MTSFEEKKSAYRHSRRLRRLFERSHSWRSRVVPYSTDTSDETSKIDEVIEGDTLTRCSRCPPHRKRAGMFRQLIGNDGDYLCDDCYRREFPATAMLDNIDTAVWQKKGASITQMIQNGFTDLFADAIGITEATHFVDANESSRKYPSEIECRMCLDRGVFRRCCSSYYCHSCYYKLGTCPGCKTEMPLTGITARRKGDPGTVALGLSWILSFLVSASTLVILGLTYWNIKASPVTVWGHVCRGWFPNCDLSVCIDFDANQGSFQPSPTIPPSQPYQICDRKSTVNQVIGSACIYDNELYVWSDHLIGYDICMSAPREKRFRESNVSSPNPLLLYSHDSAGVYVFDDDFEPPFQKASARWQEIISGNVSDACGVNSNSPERGKHSSTKLVHNEYALVFTGVHIRYATTIGLNVEYGGKIEFYLKMGSLSPEEFPECKAASSGDVVLQFRTVSREWKTFQSFPTWKYRNPLFQFISVEIPSDGWTNSTQFRFLQNKFDFYRDHWAIDDVRIKANLPSGWEVSAAFKDRQMLQIADVKRAQCCYGSEQCNVFDEKNRFSKNFCDQMKWTSENKHVSRLDSSEISILFCFLAFIANFFYDHGYKRCSHLASLKNKNDSESYAFTSSSSFPRHTFHTVSHLSWQYTVAFILLSALITVSSLLIDALIKVNCKSDNDEINGISCERDVSFYVASFFAISFDLRAVITLLTKVFVLEAPWNRKPIELVVDLHPENKFMQLGGRDFSLSDVSAIQDRKSGFMWLLSISYILGGLPVTLSLLALGTLELSPLLNLFKVILGAMAILREILGTSFLLKIVLSVRWILTLNQDDRYIFGWAVTRRGLLQQIIFGSGFSSVVIMPTIVSRSVEPITPEKLLISLASCILFGGFVGLLAGVMQGLPVVPYSFITGWPGDCYCITYNCRAHCPCLFSCTYCEEIHSYHVLITVKVNDMFSFKRMIGGSIDIEGA